MKKGLQTEMMHVSEHFRDSLLIDKFDPQIDIWQKRRFEKSSSETNEDTIVWNVFRTFNQIDRKLWVQQLFYTAFQQEFSYAVEQIEINLWKKIRPPKSLLIGEGKTDIDIIIESDSFVWFIEAKYKTDISLDTNHQSKRDELIRMIDGGTNYARNRVFYFSLLILDKYNSPMGFRMANEYKDSFDKVKNLLPHRPELPSFNGISILYWKDIQALFKTVYLYSKNKYERFLADQASYWLYNRIVNDN